MIGLSEPLYQLHIVSLHYLPGLKCTPRILSCFLSHEHNFISQSLTIANIIEPWPLTLILILAPGTLAVFLWMMTAACIKAGRPQIARRAIELAERRLAKDEWPEYYDGKLGRTIGKQARKLQTWSISGYLVAKLLLEDPSHMGMICMEEDKKCKPCLTRSVSWSSG